MNYGIMSLKHLSTAVGLASPALRQGLWLASQPLDPFLKIALFILFLVLVWVALKLLLRLALRLFACGCAVIVLLAALLVVLQILAQRGGP